MCAGLRLALCACLLRGEQAHGQAGSTTGDMGGPGTVYIEDQLVRDLEWSRRSVSTNCLDLASQCLLRGIHNNTQI